jgi:hypothetical protein
VHLSSRILPSVSCPSLDAWREGAECLAGRPATCSAALPVVPPGLLVPPIMFVVFPGSSCSQLDSSICRAALLEGIACYSSSDGKLSPPSPLTLCVQGLDNVPASEQRSPKPSPAKQGA